MNRQCSLVVRWQCGQMITALSLSVFCTKGPNLLLGGCMGQMLSLSLLNQSVALFGPELLLVLALFGITRQT